MLKFFSKVVNKGKTCPECGTEMVKSRPENINFKSYPIYLWVWHCEKCDHTEGGEAIHRNSQAITDFKNWKKDTE